MIFGYQIASGTRKDRPLGYSVMVAYDTETEEYRVFEDGDE